MKPAKWRDLSEDEMRQKVRELSEEVFNLRFQLSMGVAKNPSRLSQARRDVARALTILREQGARSEEHTSELQSRLHLVCRLLLEKKNSAVAFSAMSTL